MSLTKKIKDLKGRVNDDYIVSQYTVPYGIANNSRYKHLDELLLQDGKVINATLGPVDMSIYPFGGTNIYTVTASDENRIDIIATKVYGSASLYWIICYMNNIEDPLVLPSGRVLFIPDLGSLRQFPNPLS